MSPIVEWCLAGDAEQASGGLGESSHTRKGANHHREVVDEAIAVCPNEIDALQFSIRHPGLEDQNRTSLFVKFVDVREVLEDLQQNAEEHPDGVLAFERVKGDRAVKDDVV